MLRFVEAVEGLSQGKGEEVGAREKVLAAEQESMLGLVVVEEVRAAEREGR